MFKVFFKLLFLGFVSLLIGRMYEYGVLNRDAIELTNDTSSCNDGCVESPINETHRQVANPMESANSSLSFGTQSMRMLSFRPSANIIHWSTICLGRMLAEIMRTSTLPLLNDRKLAFRPTIEMVLFHREQVVPFSSGIWTAFSLVRSSLDSSSVTMGLTHAKE